LTSSIFSFTVSALPKIFQQGDLDLFLSEEAFEIGDALLVLLRLISLGEDLRSLLEEAGFPLRERHRMDVVCPSDLAVRAVVL